MTTASALAIPGMAIVFAALCGVAMVLARLLRANRRLRRQLASARLQGERAGEERLKLMEGLREAQARLREAESASMIGRLAPGISHDMNNPLTYVTASLEELTRCVRELAIGPRLLNDSVSSLAELQVWASSVKVREALEEAPGCVSDALDGCMRLRELVASLAALSNGGIERVSMSLAMLAADAVRISAPSIKRVRVFTHLEDPLPVRCVRGDIVRVITNLVVNAGQSCGDQGVVAVAGWREGSCAVIEVADNGNGIEPDILPRIFEPFFTTKEVGKGSGLGLPVSKEIVVAHGGRIAVYSTEGQGARFQVRLELEISRSSIRTEPHRPSREVPDEHSRLGRPDAACG